MAKQKPNSWWRRAKGTISGKRYMVLDSDGYPVHTGRDFTKTEALKIAKEARADGEKVKLVKSNPRKSGCLNPKSSTTVPAHVRINPRTGKIQIFVTPKVASQLAGVKGIRVAGNPVRQGVSIRVPRYNFDPKSGDVFFIEGKKITVKSVRDDFVNFKNSVNGTTGMSASNLYQVAYVPETSRFAGYR